jgi:RHS repeat-associated protein
MDGPYSQGYDYDVWGNVTHKYGWGGEVQGGGAGQSSDIYYTYTNNRRNGFSYDAAGNLTNDLGQTFTYDATGQQATASYMSVLQSYDGNGLRVKKTENGQTTYYLRSSVLGGQVVAEMNSSGSWTRGYVYLGGSLLAVQDSAVYWMHEDPVTKSKRVTDASGTIVSTVELDPWGADTSRSSNAAFQPRKFTSYERDANGTDEAMFRRYNRWQSRFDQPDPYDGSYSLGDPQSFNRYAYTQNDPVNFVDPSGLVPNECVFDEQGRCVIYSGYTPAESSLRAWARYANSRSLIPTGGMGREPHGKGGGGGSGPTDPQNSQQKPLDDCNHFAQMLQDIADKAADVHDFLDTVARTFTAANNSSIAEMRRTANMRMPEGRPTFVDGGFKQQFLDDSNQVRHFVGGFIAGADVGVTAALLYMNQREHPNTNGVNNPDIRLNGVSTDMGARYGANFMVGIGTIRRELVNEFVRRVCE